MPLPRSSMASDGLWAPSVASGTGWTTEVSGGGDGDDNRGGGGGGEPLQNWSSLIGIVTAIVGNVLIALALNVQRYAHTRLHKERAQIRRKAKAAMRRAKRGGGHQPGSYGTVSRQGADGVDGDSNGADNGDDDGTLDDSRETDPLNASFHSSESTQGGDDDADQNGEKSPTTYLKSTYWWLGQILITLGEMGNFLAYGFAPASIVSPLGVVALISNCLIAPLMFHERFRQRDFWGVVVAVGGVVTVVLSANTQENKLNPHDVWGAITSLEFEVYMTVTVLLIIALAWASPRYGKRTILIDLGLVGLFGGYTALATKGISSMLSSTLWRAFTTPVTYALIFILLATAIMQIRYVNKALQRFDSTQVIPIQFVMFTLCVILGSAVLYRDFEHTTAKQAGKFVGGCLLTFFGVFLITSGRGQDDGVDDEDALSEAEGVEETIGLSRQNSSQLPGDLRATPASAIQSRRSSRLSRAGYIDGAGSRSPDYASDDGESWTVRAAGSMPSSPEAHQDTSLLRNPWGQSTLDGAPGTSPPNRGARTRSADTLMRGSTVLSTSAGAVNTTMDGQLSPGHPPEAPPTTPQSRPNPFGSGQASRSGTFISPSPLASTVTSVMKDAFLNERRPLPPRSSMRHIRSRIRASLFFNDDEASDTISTEAVGNAGHNIAEAGVGHAQQSTYAYVDEEAGRIRSRSLSDTLGDLFKPKKRRRKDESDTPDTTQEHQHQTGDAAQAGPST